ncbi:MAG: bifunctional 2-C-methyl-D-erythritol 4-phosphate cytidylyltransferase/2-C-methyl-D-erythritol 2,4-cyclodiphosphate synthase [Alphaproteobacteria bacterium]|nr:bifunctional 2-C-methyl-D-erythritol 4-phosphate cytidylyltransferase/2-C-methyl-D-erythritol 2,4-cyclodiphosphate synthase [Alphaproteobacteria bacterium]
MPRLAVLIVAAGKGERSGLSRPKQYEYLAGTPMLRRTVEAFRSHPVQVVIGPGQEDLAAAALAGLALPAPVPGGATRQESVRLGLEALAAGPDGPPDFVLIHDAARPFVSAGTIAAVAQALEKGARGALPMLAVADTLRRRESAGWSTVARDNLFRAQTPQGFAFGDILAAHRAHAGTAVTDDMALAELAGIAVEHVEGDERNLKLTTKEDFVLANALLSTGETRTAMGYDAHRFTEGDHVWLCGIQVPHDHGLLGHSDADAGLHALTDALLGCIGAGDIGQHFPPTDERWKGASSDKFLAHAASLIAEKGGQVIHCDVTLICERPKVGPYRQAMRARIAEILGLDIDRVSVKATTTEGMGYTGRREGLAAQAVATVRLPA